MSIKHQCKGLFVTCTNNLLKEGLGREVWCKILRICLHKDRFYLVINFPNSWSWFLGFAKLWEDQVKSDSFTSHPRHEWKEKRCSSPSLCLAQKIMWLMTVDCACMWVFNVFQTHEFCWELFKSDGRQTFMWLGFQSYSYFFFFFSVIVQFASFSVFGPCQNSQINIWKKQFYVESATNKCTIVLWVCMYPKF